MKKGQAILLVMNIVLTALMLFNALTHVFNVYVFVLFLFVLFFVVYRYFGIEKNAKYYNKDLLFNVLIGCLIYTIVTYLLGLWLGFLRNPYSMEILKIVVRTIPIILIIVFSELIRYIFVTKGRKYKLVLVLSVISFVLVDISLLTSKYDFTDNHEILEFVLLLMAIITKNVFLTYISHKSDFKIPIVYRLYMELPMYIIPIFPNISEYVDTMLRFLLPIVFLFITYKSLAKENHIRDNLKIRKRISTSLIVILIVSFIGITCGWFKYYTLAIGSGSMSPSINKGDVVVIEKISNDEIERLKINDVLVFGYDNVIVVHRIVNIDDDLFYTKGDHNNEQDYYPVKETDILGRVSFRVPVVGYPAVWLGELLNGK